MATERDILTPAGIWELCATSQDLVHDVQLAIESSHILCRRAADLQRQSREAREAREARTAAAARQGHKA